MSRASLLGPIPPPVPGRIAIVGPCAAGKTTLARGLAPYGYQVHRCGQEHSHVRDMWQRLCRPSLVIYLDVDIEAVKQRRNVSYGEPYLQEQKRRLRHVRAHADVTIDTSRLTIEEVLQQALAFLETQHLELASNV